MTDLYIDVDGVILKWQAKEPAHIVRDMALQKNLPAYWLTLHKAVLADDVDEFIKFAAARFDCYWLTAWAPTGNLKMIRDQLLPLLPQEAASFTALRWDDLKTEAITHPDFYWVDDELMQGEKRFLEERGWLGRHILSNPYEPSLKPVMARLS